MNGESRIYRSSLLKESEELTGIENRSIDTIRKGFYWQVEMTPENLLFGTRQNF